MAASSYHIIEVGKINPGYISTCRSPYTVFNCGSQPELHLVQDPSKLGWEVVVQVERYQIDPGKILAARSDQPKASPGSSWSLQARSASPRSKKFDF